jgi:hypothetical protein
MELAFAIDDLYSTGWWPAEGSACASDTDGRWFPEQATVQGLFRDVGQVLEFCLCRSSSACRATWTDTTGKHTVVARDERTASLLALAELRRTGHPTPVHDRPTPASPLG